MMRNVHATVKQLLAGGHTGIRSVALSEIAEEKRIAGLAFAKQRPLSRPAVSVELFSTPREHVA
jgi:hypothetical protein